MQHVICSARKGWKKFTSAHEGGDNVSRSVWKRTQVGMKGCKHGGGLGGGWDWQWWLLFAIKRAERGMGSTVFSRECIVRVICGNIWHKDNANEDLEWIELTR